MINKPVYNKLRKNILKSEQVYYHKNLIIQNKIGRVTVDIDKGLLINEPTGFFIEPKASYTIKELIDYCREKIHMDKEQYDDDRIYGLLNYFVEKYGIDLTLFTIEAMSIHSIEQQICVPITKFVDYIPIGKSYMENIVNNRSKEKYVLKDRRL